MVLYQGLQMYQKLCCLRWVKEEFISSYLTLVDIVYQRYFWLWWIIIKNKKDIVHLDGDLVEEAGFLLIMLKWPVVLPDQWYNQIFSILLDLTILSIRTHFLFLQSFVNINLFSHYYSFLYMLALDNNYVWLFCSSLRKQKSRLTFIFVGN